MIRFELGVAQLSGYDDDGFVGLQIDAYGEKRSGMSAIEAHHPFGFVSRPLDPDPNGTGCSVLYGFEGNTGFAWVMNDPRIASKTPQVKKGGSAQYASDGSFAIFDPETHTWSLYLPYEFDGSGNATKAHIATIGLDGSGVPVVELGSGEGPAFTILDRTTTLTNAPGNAWIELGDSGTTVVGPFKCHGGADLGGEASQPLVLAAPLLAWATAIQAAVAALAGVPTNSAAGSAPTSAAATALAALASAGPTKLTKGA